MTKHQAQSHQPPPQPLQAKLRFQESLQAKKLSTKELQERIQTLHLELQKLGQENTDVSSLATVTRELTAKTLLHHKDKGVKSLVACCLADLLRLYAPEAPFSEEELKEIFQLFLHQLSTIGDMANPYYPSCVYLLESLSTVKSIVLLVDLPHAEEYLSQLFQDFFENIREDHLRNVKVCMLDILQQLVDEAPSIPLDCIQVLLAPFQRKQRESSPASYTLACELIKLSKDRLQHYVSQYFNDMILTGDGELSTSEVDIREAHRTILELFKISDGVLLSVIPQLEVELKVDQAPLRKLSTEVLGEMFTQRGSATAKQYPNVWNAWLQKRNDKNVEVRLIWVNFMLPLIQNHPERAKEACEMLYDRVYDPDEGVRLAVIKLIDNIVNTKDQDLIDLLTADLLRKVGTRIRDKKALVHNGAIEVVAKVYNIMYHDMFNSGTETFLKYSWIPSDIAEAMFTGDTTIMVAAEKALDVWILPPNPSDEERFLRFIVVLSTASERAFNAITGMLARFQELSKIFHGCLKEFSPQKRFRPMVIEKMAATFPETNTTIRMLQTLFENMDARSIANFQSLIDGSLSYKDTLKMKKELLKRYEKFQTAAEHSAMEAFLRRITPSIMHRQLMPNLLKSIRNPEGLGMDDRMKETAQKLLRLISKSNPILFSAYQQELCAPIMQIPDDMALCTSLLQLDQSLYALNKLSAQVDVDMSKALIQRLEEVVLKGTEKQSKYAANVFFSSKKIQEKQKQSLVEKLISLVKKSPSANQIAALTQVIVCQPELLFDSEKDDTVANIIMKSIQKPSKELPSLEESDEALVPLENLSDEFRSKFCAKRCLKRAARMTTLDGTTKLAIGSSLSTMLSIVETEGQIVGTKPLSNDERVHFRLEAGLCILKMLHNAAVENLVSSQNYLTMALCIQDPVYECREIFLTKLMKYLGVFKMHSRYLSLLFLAAYEPDLELKETVSTFITKISTRLRKSMTLRLCLVHCLDANTAKVLEMSMLRFLFILAHHADITYDVEGLQLASQYINFFLGLIANAENVSLIYYIAGRMKTVEDILGDSANIYCLSDLTQHLLREHAASHGWPIPSYPGKIDLPSNLFSKIRDSKVERKIFSKSYLCQEFLDLSSKLKVVKAEPKWEKEPKVKRNKAEESDDEENEMPEELLQHHVTKTSKPSSKSRKVAHQEPMEVEMNQPDESDQPQRPRRAVTARR